MTQPALAHATESGRMYSRKLNGQPEAPSITTVIGMQNVDLTGWAGYMAAKSLSENPALPAALSNNSTMRSLVRNAASAAENYRDEAAARGDRVHFYAEQRALAALGQAEQLELAQEQLAAHGEVSYAQQFDQWWQDFQVKPLAAEVTIWNQSLGYAGTLDLVAEIHGKICIIDYKTKGSGRNGKPKALSPSVVMQLVAGMKAEEKLLNPETGDWGPWEYGTGEQQPLLIALAIGDRAVSTLQANPEVLPQHWYKFCALRNLWEQQNQLLTAPEPLMEMSPPPAVKPS